MKKETINSLFNSLCKKYEFQRDKNSARKKYHHLDLYINLQKSGIGNYFYINVIVLYPELLEDGIDFNFNEIFGIKSPFFPHVAFRIESLMKGDGIDQNLLDNLYCNKDWKGLDEILDKSFKELINLNETGEFERANIRNTMKDGIISAIIRKDV